MNSPLHKISKKSYTGFIFASVLSALKFLNLGSQPSLKDISETLLTCQVLQTQLLSDTGPPSGHVRFCCKYGAKWCSNLARWVSVVLYVSAPRQRLNPVPFPRVTSSAFRPFGSLLYRGVMGESPYSIPTSLINSLKKILDKLSPVEEICRNAFFTSPATSQLSVFLVCSFSASHFYHHFHLQ